MAKPFSQASENNKGPILEVLQRVFANRTHVLEIGSGSGQHAVFFAEQLPHLQWQPTDREDNHAGIRAWLNEAPQPNLADVLALDIRSHDMPSLPIDAAFSANTAHIMSWPTAQLMVQKVAAALPQGGIFALYGPFNYAGEFTSESNANFDQYLRQGDPEQGIRDFEKINEVAELAGLQLQEDNAMPANNRLLVWRKV